MRIQIIVFICFLAHLSFSQEKNEKGFFEVSFEQFSPPNKAIIQSMVGQKAMPFLAPDTQGEEQYLGNFEGQIVFVYFWNKDCLICINQLKSLNQLSLENQSTVQIIAIADEPKNEAHQLTESLALNYPILYQGRLLGEAAYGIELGYPRLFVIDKNGLIKYVIPEQALSQSPDIYPQLNKILQSMNPSE